MNKNNILNYLFNHKADFNKKYSIHSNFSLFTFFYYFLDILINRNTYSQGFSFLKLSIFNQIWVNNEKLQKIWQMMKNFIMQNFIRTYFI